ncbi:MAG: hypothetical protein AAGF59_15255 [Pseudomonadota bacterium]
MLKSGFKWAAGNQAEMTLFAVFAGVTVMALRFGDFFLASGG